MQRHMRALGLLGLLFLFAGSASAITLHRSSSLELYTLDAEGEVHNAHPVNFVDPDSLAQLLASLQVDSSEAGDAIYLMSENQAIEAGAELASALSRIDDKRDVHLVTFRQVGSFPVSRRLATGARIFVEDGQLNLIFGQVDEFLDEFREPYQKRARPGARQLAALSGATIQPADWFTFKPGRKDWVLFPIDLTQSPRRLLRLQSGEMSSKASAEPARTSPKQHSSVKAPTANRWKDLEEGLETLKRLQQKGLISDDEYQSQRRALLDDVAL